VKAELRQRYLQVRRNLSKGDRTMFSLRICDELSFMLTATFTGPIVSYSPFPSEVDVTKLNERCSKAGYRVLVPIPLDATHQKYEFQDITSSERFSLEYVQKEALAWVVPGVSFDRFGHRVGLGKGVYDRFLLQSSGVKVGVCFSAQLSTSPLPVESHDVKMDFVFTESEQLSFFHH